MKKSVICSTVIILLLFNSAVALSSIETIKGQIKSSAASSPTSAYVRPDISDYMQVNLTGAFTELGYTASNVTKITIGIFNRVMLTYLRQHEYIENITGPVPNSKTMILGANSSTILTTSNSSKNTDNLDNFGSAHTSLKLPLRSSISNVPKDNSTFPTSFVTNSGDNLRTLGSESKACILVAIWSYPNDSLPAFETVFNNINSAANNYGNYQYIDDSLVDDDATSENIADALTAAAGSYDNVDLYLLGHGNTWHFYLPDNTQVDCSCYCTWDGFGNNWALDIWSCELASDTYPWYADMSALRLTFPICCYGGGRPNDGGTHYFGFQDYALNPGGSIDHPRACIAAVDGPLYTDYALNYLNKWCYYWYQNHYESSSAAYQAETYASSFYHYGVDLTYFDDGATFTCNPNYISGDVESYTYSEWDPYSAGVNCETNVIGNSDGQNAQLYAVNGPKLYYGDQAMITATMDRESAGDIYIRGQSYPEYHSHVYVYVSENGQDWHCTFNDHMVDNIWPWPRWIYCGTYNENFRYIAIVVYDDDWWSGNLFVDAVKVIT